MHKTITLGLWLILAGVALVILEVNNEIFFLLGLLLIAFGILQIAYLMIIKPKPVKKSVKKKKR